MQAGEHERAAEAFSAALAEAPDFADAWQNLACCLAALGRFREAAAACAFVVRLRPEDAGSRFNLGCVLLDGGDQAGAVTVLREAVRLDPALAKHHATLGQALIAAGRKPEALAVLREAVRLDGGNPGVLASLAGVLVDEGLFEAAADAALRAVRLDPASYQAEGNRALALHGLGRLEEAEEAGRRAVALAGPGNAAKVRHNLACMLLRAGRMTPDAWALYEWRFELNPPIPNLAAAPRWAGEPLAGRTVLLHSEQGLGDTIQFARYAPLVKALGGRVVLVVQPALLRLLRDTPGTDAVVSEGTPLPPHDVFCPLLSLPGLFGTALDSIPALIPLVPDPALVQHWRRPSADGLHVGLVWAGSPGFVHDRARSIGPALPTALAGMPGLVLHSLQHPAGQADVGPIIDRMPNVADFADTAAIIAGLDLVISVDSAVAHLAATMGKEVWLLSRAVGCWRWLHDREDSPWYPTMRIYHQTEAGDWAGVIARVRDDLAHRLAHRIAGLPRTARSVLTQAA